MDENVLQQLTLLTSLAFKRSHIQRISLDGRFTANSPKSDEVSHRIKLISPLMPISFQTTEHLRFGNAAKIHQTTVRGTRV